ncbi:MAG: AAA family ATPase [Candidatus Pacearchaeota archaeon]
MRIEKIILKNIRSYEYEEINFPKGSILLSGDIGSGKTSVLLGIEFALFGLQPGQRGASILRNGASEGVSILEFSIDKDKIRIERNLVRKGKSISQEYCVLIINGKRYELSVTESKDKILEILNYPKEFIKRQNLLYKFTVYTPQEEMKQIILEDPETRINTLRHIFGIDKYKIILENISVLASKLREERRIKEESIQNLEEEKAELILKEEDLESKRYNLSSVEKNLFIASEERKRIQVEKEAILEKIEERKRIQQEIEKSKIILKNKEEILSNNLRTIEQLESQVEEISKITFSESMISEAQNKLKLLKIEKDKLNNESLQIGSQINSLNLKNQENELIKKRLEHIEICPTCLQDVGPVYKTNILNKIDSDITENKKKIGGLIKERDKLLEKISKVSEEVSNEEKRLRELEILRLRVRDAEEKKHRIEEIKKINETTRKDIEILKNHLENLTNIVFEMNKFNTLFEIKQTELEESLKKERAAEIKVVELKKEIEMLSLQIENLREKIKKSEEIKKKVAYLSSIESWLIKNFSPLISLIEKNVMIKLKKEFSKLFSRWFSMLVPDAFYSRLDDDFTPIIDYQDYEIDYSYLSGGERTAVALAYRLALNQVINSFLSKIKTKGLIILDEPTDGFSEQQLDKIRDVLKQLEAEQLIIVSHEQKMESFVEKVIKFKKERGVSKVLA